MLVAHLKRVSKHCHCANYYIGQSSALVGGTFCISCLDIRTKHTRLGKTEPDDETLALEAELIAGLKAAVWEVATPLLVLGSGRAQLKHKSYVVMHAFLLIAGHKFETLKYLCDAVLSNTTDFGVEYLLGEVQQVPISDLFPWHEFVEDNVFQPGCNITEGDDFVEVDEPPFVAQPHTVAIDKSYSIPGLLHIPHNAGDRLTTLMRSIDETVDGLDEICKLVSHTHTKERPVETRFNTILWRVFSKAITKFNAHVHRKRWGSIAFANVELLSLMNCLRALWSMPKYMKGSGSKHLVIESEDSLKAGPKIDLVDRTIKSPFFWGMLIKADFLYGCMRQAFEWVEECPCHSHLSWDGIAASVRLLWASCPLRGCRIAEIFWGDLLKKDQEHS